MVLGCERVLALVVKWFNFLLQGPSPDQADCLKNSRMVLLQKATGGLRPIAVGEAWLRLLGRLVASKTSSNFGDASRPLQVGVGVKGGAENIIHSINLVREVAVAQAEQDPLDASINCVLTVDFANAFNTIRRLPIFRALEEGCPSLTPFFYWA